VKTRSRSASGIGSPSFHTETPTASATAGGPNTSTSIRPPGLANLIALDSRLPRTRASFSGSPTIVTSVAAAATSRLTPRWRARSR
jgi:hypothetical protein